MGNETRITRVHARQIYSDRGHPGVETTVFTANGARGTAVVTAGTSVGTHEVTFAYDEGTGWLGFDWKGKGVGRAVAMITEVIAPRVIGMDAADQLAVDDLLIRLDGTPEKSNLGGNATASVSAATLKAGAAALGLPLYQHIGGAHASLMPTPAALMALGGRRYQRNTRTGTKPTYSLVCYGFGTYSEASHAGWCLLATFRRLLWDRFHMDATNVRDQHIVVSPGFIQHDRALWDLMVEAIALEKLEGKVGIQVDVAASTYFDDGEQRFIGLFSVEPKSRDQLIRLYEEMVANYPFVIIEDPLDEDDWEGHAHLVHTLGIEIVGDDLFATNPARVQRGIETGACNAVLLKVNQIGTITESFDMVQLAYRQGYGVMPCDSRGEGADIADYTVGLGTGHLREGAPGATANRFLQIEAELGARARFAGRAGLKLSRTDR